MAYWQKQKKWGFTLIELMMVIAIISILSTTVFSLTKSARTTSGDNKRVGDLRGVQKVLEFFYLDNNIYPVGWAISYDETTWDNGLGVLLKPYISKLPQPPNPEEYSVFSNFYQYINPGVPTCFRADTGRILLSSGYLLTIAMETIGSPHSNNDSGVNSGYFEIYGGSYHKVPSCGSYPVYNL